METTSSKGSSPVTIDELYEETRKKRFPCRALLVKIAVVDRKW